MNLVSIMKDVVIEKICRRINKARYFSIIANFTQDSSKAETTVHDEARNISRSEQELQKFVQKVCPVALYISCHSHRFA